MKNLKCIGPSRRAKKLVAIVEKRLLIEDLPGTTPIERLPLNLRHVSFTVTRSGRL
jgi:hypothetical protein